MINLKLFEYFDKYLVDKHYKITINGEKIHIMNYIEVEDFSSTRVVVRYDGGKTIISGIDLVVTKMLDEELLITGKIKMIEYN